MENRYNRFPTWSEYVSAISARFGKMFDDPLSELVGLKQSTDSVDDYLDTFECTLTRMTLSDSHDLSIFLTNMQPHLAFHVRQFPITSVAEAARVARLRESSLQHTPQKFSRALFSSTTKKYPQPTQKPLIPEPEYPKPITQNTLPSDKPPRRFSYEEMQDRRSKGLCMFCEEQLSPGQHL